MKIATKTRTLLASLALAAFALTATASFAGEAKDPMTAAEHDALATQYKAEAVQYKKVADEHKVMAQTYAKEHPDSKGGVKNPWNEKMQQHCAMLAKDADKLASDADKAADYHTMRGKELQGK